MMTKAIASLALAVLFAAPASAEILYWYVNQPSDPIEFTFASLYAVGGDGTKHQLTLGADATLTVLANGVSDPTPVTGTGTGPVFANLGEYGSSAYSYYVELYSYASGTSALVGVSGTATYNDLLNSKFIYEGGITLPDLKGAWAPTIAPPPVPEPTGGLLVTLGLALLSLRRRRRI